MIHFGTLKNVVRTAMPKLPKTTINASFIHVLKRRQNDKNKLSGTEIT